MHEQCHHLRDSDYPQCMRDGRFAVVSSSGGRVPGVWCREHALDVAQTCARYSKLSTYEVVDADEVTA